MPQQPPDLFRPPQGPRFGCADVTIVSIASIAAFVLLIFVVLRPDFARFIDLTGGNDVTVSAVRATDTPGGPFFSPTPGTPGVSDTSGASTVLTSTGTTAAGTTVPGTTASGTPRVGATATIASFNTPLRTTPAVPPTPTTPPTPTPPPTLSFVSVKLTDVCRLRQNPSYQAAIIQIFPKGTAFKAYDQKQSVKDTDTGVTSTWQKVEPDDSTNRLGWMIVECLGT